MVSLNTTSETEAERIEKIHDVEFEERLRAARESGDPRAVAKRIGDSVYIEPWSILNPSTVNPYRRALEEVPLSEEARTTANELIGQNLEQRFAQRGDINKLCAEIGDLLAPLSREEIQRCQDVFLSVIRHQASTASTPTTTNDTHTLDWAYSRWLRIGEGDRKSDSVKTALRHWNAFLSHSKLVMLSDVRRSHMLAWRDSLTDAGKHRPKSINQRLQLVIAILRAGWRDAEMPQPDLKAITLPEPDDNDRGSWNRDEILRALTTLPPHSWRSWIFLLGLTTGVRLGEPVVAQRPWWNPSTGFIEIRYRSLTKADKEHAIPIIECLRAPFMAYVARRPDGFLFDAPRPQDPDVPISNVASKALNRFFQRQGIDRVFHELRDTWIEAARHSSVEKDIWEIISGHSRLTVSDRYGGKKPEVLMAANETICQFLTGDSEIKVAMLRLVG